MASFTLTGHVQGQKTVVSVTEDASGFTVSIDSGQQRAARNLNQAIGFALDAVRSFFQSRLKRPSQQQWGVRVTTPCGTFDFGDWSFEPLTGTGGFPSNEPILEIFNKWKNRREPQHALSGSRELITYCLGRG